MFRSLYSGVSGLNANLIEIDVIGNNIANSNTVGFKSGRVTFNEMLTQQIKSASRPISGGRGGTNPQQVGLGTTVGSIDTNFTQGNFRTTGVKTDLALQGPGFFILSDGISNHYTRAGVFGLDSDNVLVNPTTGLRVQGVLANENGEVVAGAMTDIMIDPSLVMPARASESIQLFGNLDADSDAIGTVLESDAFIVAATGDDLLTSMYGEHDGRLGLRDGDLITISLLVDGAPQTLPSFVVGGIPGVDGGTTYEHLRAWLETTLRTNVPELTDGAGGSPENISVSIMPDGSLSIDNDTDHQLRNLSLAAGGKAGFNQNFQFSSIIDMRSTGSTGDGDEAGELRAPATADDLFEDLYNEDGQSISLEFDGGISTVAINGTRGGEAITPTNVAIQEGVTTVGDFLTQMQAAFRVSSTPITLDDDGHIVMQGEVGLANALGDVSISEIRTLGSTNDVIGSSFNFTQTQQARDTKSFSVATTIYDSLGGTHTLSFSFEKVSGENEWIWTADLEGNEELMTGGTGRVRFTEDGAVASWTYEDGSSALTFRPQPTGEEGADIVTVQIDYGDIGGLNGLTQFDGGGSLQSLADGYTSGEILDFEIDQNGYVIGHFSNDTMRNLARIGIATFSNPEGLVRESDNTYRLSGNSGLAMETFAGENGGTTIVPGTLETSNVDLAEQFTRLVIAQRAFQANSRVITTGDQLMQELVSIIR